jgi:hypothetical protein
MTRPTPMFSVNARTPGMGSPDLTLVQAKPTMVFRSPVRRIWSCSAAHARMFGSGVVKANIHGPDNIQRSAHGGAG